jgi:hypothetical protein
VAFEEVAKLTGGDIPPTAFFPQFLEKALVGIDAPAGAIWLRNPQGFLQLQCQAQIDQVGLDKHKNGRQTHNELLRQAFQTAKPIILEPYGSTGIVEGIPAGNPTDYVVMLAPILQDEKTAVGLLEVWIEPRWDAKVKRMHLNYVVQMAGYASTYIKNQQGRQSLNQEQLWTQLEAFACQIHSTLNLTEVAYHIANEGRRLIGCDRLSVLTREAKKARVEAVSGADVVEKRSTQMTLMRRLADGVFNWDEKLVYRGTKDEGLPPDVLEALDAYLAESHAKLLILLPLHDERDRDKETKEFKPGSARSALLMECYEPPASPDPLIARVDVISRHATGALYNAAELKIIPLRWLWMPVLSIQKGLGGKTKFYTTLVSVLAAVLILAMIFVPLELKLDAKGKLLPVVRRAVYSTREAKVIQFHVTPNSRVGPNQALVTLFDPQLAHELTELNARIRQANSAIISIENQLANQNLAQSSRQQLEADKITNRITITELERQLDALRRLNNCLPEPGFFQVMSPTADMTRATSQMPEWVILSGSDFNDLVGRMVKSSDPLLRIGEITGDWEVELKIPQKHIGKVLEAVGSDDLDSQLDVDLKFSHLPTETYRGHLARRRIAGEAVPNRDDHNEMDPVVYAFVGVTSNDIPEDQRVPHNLLLADVESRTKVRCGKHSMGYSLFYGVWEFLCEKVYFNLF